MSASVTILELALHRGAQPDDDGAISCGEVEQTGLPFFAGCECCAASLSAYNACPSKSGFIRCTKCIGECGWSNVEEANRDIFGDRDNFKPEAFIVIAADSIAALRKCDVHRLIDTCPPDNLAALCAFILEHRKDLQGEVMECLDELMKESS